MGKPTPMNAATTCLRNFIVVSVLCCSNATHAQITPLYLNINSHNETDDPNNYANPVTYSQVKSIILQIADTVSTNGARWNMQVESNLIRACIANENGNTNPNDMLDSLDNLPAIEIDPHNHFDTIPTSMTYNPYNYADLAHLLDSCGLQSPRKNMGGFLWQVGSDWMPYQAGAPGHTYSSYTWQPNVVWGAGSPGHTNDYDVYGLWKPAGPGIQFTTHNASRHLVCIGNGCSNVLSDSVPVTVNINQVINLINYIASLPYDPNACWTASIQFNFRDLNMPGLADSIGQIIHALQPYVNSGQVVWMTLTEKYDNWFNLHSNPGDYFQEACDSLTLGIGENITTSLVSVYPNPFSNEFVIHADRNYNSILITDVSGRLIYRRDDENESSETINAEQMTPGSYYIRLFYADGTSSACRVVKY